MRFVLASGGDGAVCDASGSYQDMALAISLEHKNGWALAPRCLKAIIWQAQAAGMKSCPDTNLLGKLHPSASWGAYLVGFRYTNYKCQC